MLTVNKLEKIIELEASLRSEYQQQLDSAADERKRLEQAHENERQALQDTINQQLATIKDLTSKSTVSQRLEDDKRELTNRSNKLQEEVTAQKKRIRNLQRELAEAREQIKTLTQARKSWRRKPRRMSCCRSHSRTRVKKSSQHSRKQTNWKRSWRASKVKTGQK